MPSTSAVDLSECFSIWTEVGQPFAGTIASADATTGSKDANGGLADLPLGFLFLMAGLPLIYNIVMSFQDDDMFSLGTFSRP